MTLVRMCMLITTEHKLSCDWLFLSRATCPIIKGGAHLGNQVIVSFSPKAQYTLCDLGLAQAKDDKLKTIVAISLIMAPK